MKIEDLVNMPYPQLKAQAEELVTKIEREPPAELAKRLVQALGDAKNRDEKLAVQGQHITNLDETLKKRDGVLEMLQIKLMKMIEEGKTTATEISRLQAALTEANATIDVIRRQKAELQERVHDLETQVGNE